MTPLTLSQIYKELKNDVRQDNYRVYEQLFEGNHFAAFSIKSEKFKDEYERLRYVVCNFAGLTSKVIADMLFGEPVTFKDEENQEFIDALVFEKDLNTLFYEHSIANSYFGDNLFKIRVEDNLVQIEDSPPGLYLPELDPGNVRAKPKRQHLMWKRMVGDDDYIIVETHTAGTVEQRVGKVVKKGEYKIEDMDVEKFNKMAGTSYQAIVETNINRSLLIHVPNWKARGYFGISDYTDLKQLLFALNNRMTKTDNILDKHSDPILAVPDGVLDEDNKVKSEALAMFEMDEEGNKPEYIVWNASLDNAFKQIDKIVEFLFMFSETSPDALGMGKGGAAESGRALKMKLLRTIAKRNRKKLYYDKAIKEVIFTTELLVVANKGFHIGEDFKKVKPTNPKPPETIWQDGVVNDEVERTEIVIKKVESSLMSEKQAIMELGDIKEDEAEKIIKDIDKEKESKADFTSFVDKNAGNTPPVKKDKNNDKPVVKK